MQAFRSHELRFDQAASVLDLTLTPCTLMITPGSRELRVEVTIEMDSGQIGNFIAYRVQHDNGADRSKGAPATIPTSIRTRPARSPA